MIVASGAVELGSDENAFAIRASSGELAAPPWSETALVEIPGGTDDVLVLTADQWGPFSVTTELHDSAPELATSWEDVVEFSVQCGGGLVVAELVTHDPCTTLVETPGEHRIRVSGSGRGTKDPDDEDETGLSGPREIYLIQAWPAPMTAPVVLRETSAWARAQSTDRPAPDDVPERIAGLTAARRIGRDANGDPGARPLSGSRTSIEFEHVVRGARRQLSKELKFHPDLSHHLPSWSLSATSLGWEKPSGGSLLHSSYEDHPDQLPGRGCIRTTLLEDQGARGWTSGWTWMGSPPSESRAKRDQIPLFDDTLVNTTYEQFKDAEGQPWTRMTVRHSNVPAEWADDLTDWWRYQLAVLRSVADQKS